MTSANFNARIGETNPIFRRVMLCTGAVGTQIDYITISWYDDAIVRNLAQIIPPLRAKAISLGLNNLEYGIDEGGFVSGPDGDDLAYGLRTYGDGSLQTSWDARMLKELHDLDISWFARWTMNTVAV